MAQAARVLWPRGRALAWRLGGSPAPRLPVQSRAGFAGAAGGPGPTAIARKGSRRLLGRAALALGGAVGLYYTARWHLRAQDVRAQSSAAQVSPGCTELRAGRGAGVSAELRDLGSGRVRNRLRCPLVTLGE